MLNVFPEDIARSLRGAKLCGYAVIEISGTKVICDDSFTDAYHIYERYSLPPRCKAKEHVTLSRYGQVWNLLCESPVFLRADAVFVYVFDSPRVLIHMIFSDKGITQVMSNFYTIDLTSAMPVVDKINDYVAYHRGMDWAWEVGPWFKPGKSKRPGYRLVLDKENKVWIKRVKKVEYV